MVRRPRLLELLRAERAPDVGEMRAPSLPALEQQCQPEHVGDSEEQLATHGVVSGDKKDKTNCCWHHEHLRVEDDEGEVKRHCHTKVRLYATQWHCQLHTFVPV